MNITLINAVCNFS